MATGEIGQVVGATGQVLAGVSLINAILVEIQNVPFDVQSSDGVKLLFAFRDEDVVEMRSDITDHYTEDNTSLQDQIAIKPIEVTVHGYIGELSDISNFPLARQIQNIATRLGVLPIYQPKVTAQVLEAYNAAKQIYDAASSAVNQVDQLVDNVSSLFGKGKGSQNKQQVTYSILKDKWQRRKLFTVKTPWDVLTDMAIVSIRANQDGDTDTITDFRITFKQMKFANTFASKLNIYDSRASVQNSSTQYSSVQNAPNIGPVSTSLTQATT